MKPRCFRILCQKEQRLFLSSWVLTRLALQFLEERIAGHYISASEIYPKLCAVHILDIPTYS